MAAGFIFGKVGFWIAEKMHRFHTFKLNRNHRFATPLVTAVCNKDIRLDLYILHISSLSIHDTDLSYSLCF